MKDGGVLSRAIFVIRTYKSNKSSIKKLF